MNATPHNTKLLIPGLTAALIARHRLLEQLHEAIQTKRLTLLSAPAGSGKTTAILALRQRWPQLPLVWLSLGTEDQELARFVGLLIAALRQQDGHFGERTLDIVNAATPVEVAAALANEMLALRLPLTIVLDDLHRVDSPAVYELLDHLLERQPAQVHWVVTSRHDPPLRLGQLRLREHMAEFRQEQLRLDAQETAQLLHNVAGYHPTAEELGQVYQRTQGWAAGVKLLALFAGPAARPATTQRLTARPGQQPTPAV